MYPLLRTLVPTDALFAVTVDTFFYFNKLWLLREVAQPCYTNVYLVADYGGLRREVSAPVFDAHRALIYTLELASFDDWIDVLFLSGSVFRNVQRTQQWQQSLTH